MHKEQKRWFGLIPFLVLPLWLIFINYKVDPANIFHDVSREAAVSIVAGNKTYITSGNLDERNVKYNLILEMPKDTEAIAVGPSLVMCVGEELVGTESYYNLGESGADFYDILAQFGVMNIYKKYPGRVIFCVDSYFFDENIYENAGRHNAMLPFAIYMLDILNGEKAEVPEINLFEKRKQKFEQLFSISYFQSAFMYAKSKHAFISERIGIADDTIQTAYYMPDGSWIYEKTFQENGIEDVKRDAQAYNIEGHFSKGKHISRKSKDTFEQLIKYLESHGAKVELFLCPLSPSLWDRIDLEEYLILTELEVYAHEIAGKYKLKITGSYNPYLLDITDDKFYDSRHVKRQYLGEYFDFSED